MARQIPSFLTGANAKIKINGQVMAFATDIAYNITVTHGSPRVLGRYEVEENQPLKYDVKGSFSILRYVASPGILATTVTNPNNNGFAGAINFGTSGGIADASNKGSGIGSYTDVSDPLEASITNGGAVGSLDPGKLYRALSFTIEIWQKTVDGDCAVARFRNCRISQADMDLSKKKNARQTFQFLAQYADEDTFVTNESGTGQQYS